MGLAIFIQQNTEEIITEWQDFARSMIPSATDMTPLALRNHIREILAFIINDMETSQTKEEQIKKSRGEGRQRKEPKPSAAETHAALRLAGGFNLDQMVSEYRALRASIVKLWREAGAEAGGDSLEELTRFNEAIDQALTESISHYARKLGESKDMFLGILTHDLRNPLGAMLGAAELIPKIGALNDRQRVLVAQITDSGGRISEIISHLLDITKARFGSGLSVVRAPMDMGYVANKIVDEMRAQHQDRKFTLEVSGEMEGNWDQARIGQVFSNLLGNAVQYSFKSSFIDVRLEGAADEVQLSVRNMGVPIPPDKIGRIFDSLLRATAEGEEGQQQTSNLGLGLYITREVVTAHGGTISVTSSERDGTVFLVRLPRKDSSKDDGTVPAASAGTGKARGEASETRLH